MLKHRSTPTPQRTGPPFPGRRSSRCARRSSDTTRPRGCPWSSPAYGMSWSTAPGVRPPGTGRTTRAWSGAGTSWRAAPGWPSTRSPHAWPACSTASAGPHPRSAGGPAACCRCGSPRPARSTVTSTASTRSTSSARSRRRTPLELGRRAAHRAQAGARAALRGQQRPGRARHAGRRRLHVRAGRVLPPAVRGGVPDRAAWLHSPGRRRPGPLRGPGADRPPGAGRGPGLGHHVDLPDHVRPGRSHLRLHRRARRPHGLAFRSPPPEAAGLSGPGPSRRGPGRRRRPAGRCGRSPSRGRPAVRRGRPGCPRRPGAA